MPQIHTQSQQAEGKLPFALILAATVLLAIPFHLRPENFIVDDGYFYPQIARYIAHGEGSTFNGIVFTNGYHPLWMVFCVLAAKITTSSNPLIQILTALQDLFTLCSLVLFVKIGEVGNKRGIILGCLPILFFSMTLGIWRLLEANLALLLQLAVIALVLPLFPVMQNKLGRWRIPLIGLVLGLALLARLDLIFFAITVLVYELFDSTQTEKFASRMKHVLLQGVIVSAALAPYLAWNLLRFHHLEPISGAIKGAAAQTSPIHIGSYAYPVIAAIVLNCTLLLKAKRTPFDTLCILTAIASLLHLVYTVCFGGLSPWYLTTGYLSVSLCIIWLSDAVLNRLNIPVWIERTVGILVLMGFLGLASLRLFSNFSYTRLSKGEVSFGGSYTEPKRALAEKLRDSLPAGSRIFIFDAPGGVAYYSGMSVMPADGLVSDYGYNTDLLREGFDRYATTNHIDYFIAPYVESGQIYDRLFLKGEHAGTGQIYQVQTPLGNHPAGEVMLPDSSLLFRFREINPDLEKTFPEIGVWRIRH